MNREEAAEALALLTRVVRQARDDTTLQNWGTIWVIHGIVNGAAFIATDLLLQRGHESPLPYAALWAVTISLNLVGIFVLKEGRSGVPSFLEGQIWSIWSTFIAAMVLTALVNWLMGLRVFFMAPVAAILAAVAFSAMGGLMGRIWYVAAAFFALLSLAMAAYPQWKLTMFGIVWCVVQTGGGIVLTVQKRRKLAQGGPAGPRLV